MRSLTVAVVVESVLLVVLAVIWVMRGDAAAAPGTGPARAGTTDAAAAAARSADLSGGDATAMRAQEDTRRRIEAVALGASASILLRGRLVAPAGDSIPNNLSIELWRDGEWRSASVANGQYAAAGLAPGIWEITPRAKDFVAKREALLLGATATHLHDLVLERAQTVAVYLRTTDGLPLLDALKNKLGPSSFAVAAFERPLEHDLPAMTEGQVSGVGCARWSSARERGKALPEVGPQAAPDGTLILDREPPVHAALFFRHLVIAQQPIQAGQDSLTFSVDPASIVARCGTVRARLIDATTGQPVTSGARFDVHSAEQADGGKPEIGAEGRVLVTGVPPGTTLISIMAGDRGAPTNCEVVIPAGGTLDLGDVALHAVVTWKGRMTDMAGAGVSGSVQWTDLAMRRARGTSSDRRSTMADGDGEFTIQSGPGRFLVEATPVDGRRGHAIVDVGTGTNPPFELRVGPVTQIRVIASGDPLRGYALELLDERGELVAVRRIQARWRETNFDVPPGRYQLEVWDDADTLLEKRAIEVGAQALRVELPR
ncbi:MAG: hypothetical protein HZB39_17525 [Planctomycetes bacterium]|nr:hypothetical protein [Planctomycetota bacterium]